MPKRGFTLIELLVVISIIAILVAAATVSWRNAQMKGRDGKRKVDLKAVQQALETYLAANSKYPDDNAGGQLVCNITGIDVTVKSWGGTFVCNNITYMQTLPQDPAYQGTTGYFYNNTGTTSYVLSAELENDNDKDRITGTEPCDPQGTRDFCVENP